MKARVLRARTPLYALTPPGVDDPSVLRARVRPGHVVKIIVPPTIDSDDGPLDRSKDTELGDRNVDDGTESYLELFLTPEAAIEFRVRQIVAEGENGTDPTPSAIDQLLTSLVCVFTLDKEFVVERLLSADHPTSTMPRLRTGPKPVGLMFCPGPTGDDRRARLLLRLADIGSPSNCWSSPYGANWSRHAELRIADDRFLPLLVDQLVGVRVR